MLVGQCTGTAACELPTGVPWYFGLVFAAVWVAVVVGAMALARRLWWQRRRTRRGDVEQPALGRRSSRTDVERW
ncbi:MAG TPA: hypothetical protein VM143_02405 [Acidimicrobiales bacterium]|nr:hypothetical protein [Acidimicrobiales bacterium]